MSELSGAELDAAVAKVLGWTYHETVHESMLHIRSVTESVPFWLGFLGDTVIAQKEVPKFSTDWSQGGPIIEREVIELICTRAEDGETIVWEAGIWPSSKFDRTGPTPLIAAMRAFVASKA